MRVMASGAKPAQSEAKGLNLSLYEYKELVVNQTLQSLSRNMYLDSHVPLATAIKDSDSSG